MLCTPGGFLVSVPNTHFDDDVYVNVAFGLYTFAPGFSLAALATSKALLSVPVPYAGALLLSLKLDS